MVWTHFWDMHSGGGQKEKYHHIFIEAPLKEAEVIFYNHFGHSSDRVTCTCCGPDYSVSEYESLAEASGYQRGCAYDPTGHHIIEEPDTSYGGWRGQHYMTVEAYFDPTREPDEEGLRESALAIYAADIKSDERVGDVPTQGYVWQD